ncbi:oxygenase MpaB family protein [Actinocorallia longicatena]|uniref:Oxygenase MpaB family protein n=1 Tax=Actinocorallia longicatena TaxID=111803 RepID=A0ABP6Q4H4_9ACTN
MTSGRIPGPGSLTHRYAADWRLGLVSRATLLLQVAHPVVGAGVAEHSDFVNDRWGRLTRTVNSTHAFFGFHGEERGREEAARLREVHKHLKGVDAQGRRYHALDPEAYLWVHATLHHGMSEAQRLLGRPLDRGARLGLFSEWRALALALGITERHLPADPDAFDAYFAKTASEHLEDNPTVRLIIALDEKPYPPPPSWRLPSPVWNVPALPLAAALRLCTAAALTPELRERFGLSWSPARRRRFDLFAAAARRLPERGGPRPRTDGGR